MITCEQGTCIFLLYRPGRTSDRSDQVVAAPCLCASLGNAESCPPEITKNSSTMCRLHETSVLALIYTCYRYDI